MNRHHTNHKDLRKGETYCDTCIAEQAVDKEKKGRKK